MPNVSSQVLFSILVLYPQSGIALNFSITVGGKSYDLDWYKKYSTGMSVCNHSLLLAHFLDYLAELRTLTESSISEATHSLGVVLDNQSRFLSSHVKTSFPYWLRLYKFQKIRIMREETA
jgi:hypothetical protein